MDKEKMMLWKLIELMVVVGGLMTVARIFYTEWKGKEVGDILGNTLLVAAICITGIGLVPSYTMSIIFTIFLVGNVLHIRGKKAPGKWMGILSGVLLMVTVAVISLEQGFGPMSFAVTMAIGIALGLGVFSTKFLLFEEDAIVFVLMFAASWVTYILFVENELHTMFASVIATILLGVYLREKRVVWLIFTTQLLGLGYLLFQFFTG